ncbi:hypothetical protein PIROE2DRAFT_12112 [Piromyces sp. E2]|nr:hypothetical protein PIROE2DRAFT_12112 [Piromyces sp. E2]|eukprot:OUM61809.1 hypothetical protein PIROE2DRAFT_12112 [Piromyces sp. E2]
MFSEKNLVFLFVVKIWHQNYKQKLLKLVLIESSTSYVDVTNNYSLAMAILNTDSERATIEL